MDKGVDNVFLSNHVAAFIDILGQQEQLRSINILPDTDDPEQRDRFVAVLKETLGVVQDLHEFCANFFDVYKKQAVRVAVPPDKREAYENLHKADIRFQRFSDGLVVFLSVANSIVQCPVNGIFGLLGACGTACLRGLAGKHPIRAGIDIGWGAELNQNELYGSVIPKAYTMESKVAQYPRIAVGDDLVSYLHSFDNAQENDIYTQFNRALATSCLELLSIDSDGVMFVDYLGEGFKKYISADLDPTVVKTAFEFVLDQLVHWGRRRNTKLVTRYLMLRDYFACRWPLWLDERDLPTIRM